VVVQVKMEVREMDLQLVEMVEVVHMALEAEVFIVEEVIIVGDQQGLLVQAIHLLVEVKVGYCK
jgi:hypothetical protein